MDKTVCNDSKDTDDMMYEIKNNDISGDIVLIVKTIIPYIKHH
jgi:hypothetical protein